MIHDDFIPIINRAIEDYDLAGQITSIVHQAIREKVERYFQTDPGREAIESAVDRTISALLM